MGKKTPKAPKPPDPYATANAQAAANRQSAYDTAALNQIGTVGPWGETRFEGAIGSPDRRQVTVLNPQAQAAFDAQQQIARTLSEYGQTLSGRVAQTPAFDLSGMPEGGQFTRVSGPSGGQVQNLDLSNLPGMTERSAVAGPVQAQRQSLDTTGIADFGQRAAVQGPGGPQVQALDTSGLPGLRSNIGGAGEGLQGQLADAGAIQRDIDLSMFGNPNLARDQVQQALFERMNPQIQQDRDALETRLAQQGIGIGSAAYNAEMDRFQRGVNDARLAAVLNAGTEQSRLFGLGRDLGGFRNAAQQQAFGQNLAGATFANQAQAQGFGQRAQDAAFQNAANQQGFGQRLAGAQFGAAEDARRVSQGLDVAGFGAGEQERIAQGLAAQRAQQFGERLAGAEFGAGEDQRVFQAGLAGAQFGAGEQERLARGSEGRQEQAFQQVLARGQFGQQEDTRLFGLGMDAARFGSAEDQRAFGNQNVIRDRAIQEALLQRQQPMNELAALLQGAPSLNMPQGVDPGQYGIQPGDIQGQTNANYAAQMQQWNTRVANKNAMFDRAFGLGGKLGAAFILQSDRRLKRDIRRIGERNGLPLYEYRYLFGNKLHVGHMADEVAKVRPDAVLTDAHGYMAVDYGRLAA